MYSSRFRSVPSTFRLSCRGRALGLHLRDRRAQTTPWLVCGPCSAPGMRAPPPWCAGGSSADAEALSRLARTVMCTLKSVPGTAKPPSPPKRTGRETRIASRALSTFSKSGNAQALPRMRSRSLTAPKRSSRAARSVRRGSASIAPLTKHRADSIESAVESELGRTTIRDGPGSSTSSTAGAEMETALDAVLAGSKSTGG